MTNERAADAEAEILYDNDLYKVVVGITEHYVHKNPAMKVYKVINKKTGVTELESSVYSAAIGSSDDLLQEVKNYGMPLAGSDDLAVENLEVEVDGNSVATTH